ncbi:MAG: class I SAM-dependent methyltransferase [Deltaproteobacteria bacterium]|nr:class I SAM-dependent methyltransferase [Deltaproteobacteria bacterium]
MISWTPLLGVPLLICVGCGSISRSFMNASWRDRWQQPDVVIQSLSLQPGNQVADLGAGGGYFTFRLADAVGPTGKVYAVDIDKGNLEYIAKQAAKRGYPNIETILAKPDDPLLPATGVDLIFTCNTYHHLTERTAYFQSATRYLKPGGRVAIIDLAGKSWIFRILGHWTPKETSQREMEAAGYSLQKDFNFLDRQMFQVFQKNS